MADDPATNPEIDDTNEELLLDTPVDPEERTEDDPVDTNVNDEADEEEVFSFGDDPSEDQPDDSPLIKQMRKELRDAKRENAELRRSTTPADKPIEVGEKPTLAGCEYDEEAYEEALDEWKTRKAEADEQERTRTQATEDQQKAWESLLSDVQSEKQALGRPDADEVFTTVRDSLSDQQNIALLHIADKGNRGKLIYALGKNPQQLEKLSALQGESNLIAFIKEVTKLEGQLKMVKRRKAPDPDTPERGSASAAPNLKGDEKRLAELEKKFEKGELRDRTEITRLKRKLGK
jgi:hypothetical protein